MRSILDFPFVVEFVLIFLCRMLSHVVGMILSLPLILFLFIFLSEVFGFKYGALLKVFGRINIELR
jgi:hypothetical protein